MVRLFLLATTVAICLLCADAVFAQGGAAPGAVPGAAPAPAAGASAFHRESGGYLSVPKMLAFWVVFLCWVHTTDWVSTDCQDVHLQYIRWNPIVFGTFMGFFILGWLLPWFWLGFPLLVIAYLTPLMTYVVYRNQHVAPNHRVLTRAHLRYWFSVNLRKLGVKIAEEKRAAWEMGPAITLEGAGRGERDNRANTVAARQLLGFNEARRVMAESLGRRATATMLDFGQEEVAVRYMIDGVWHNDEPQGRDVCDPMLEALKVLCGLNPQERKARQNGRFSANFDAVDYSATVITQGTATGERVVVQFESDKVQFRTLDDLGMRPKMQERVLELLAERQGLVLFSAMPASGLRSTTNVLLQKTDRFTREFLSIEDEAHPYERVENIPVTTYKSGPGTPEADQLMPVLVKLFRMEPEVFVMRDFVDGEAINFLCEKLLENRLVIGTVRAKDCAEAILRVLALKASPKAIARSLTCVLNQRLIRKLCEECKEPYAPTPQVLQQLGIPPGRVQAFFRPPQEPERVCEKCGGIGYFGRTAIFELMAVEDSVRQLIATSAKTDEIRQAARKAGMQNLQAEGTVLVAKGITSLPELVRVMKQ